MSTSTVTPVAIDAFVPIDTIDVNGRHRRDMGDIRALADSIADVGLLNPVTLTREGRLVAGQRRLEAVRLCGMDTVPARFADNLDDAAKLLRAERDENVCRKDMTASELYALGKGLEELERPKAEQRQREARSRAGKIRQGTLDPASCSGEQDAGNTRDAIGEALGMSATTWHRLKHMGDRAADGDQSVADVLHQIDSGEQTITGGYRKIREPARTVEVVSEPEAEPEIASDLQWIPRPNEKGSGAARRRRELIAEMAPRGYTSTQIGDRLGILPHTIRRIAREEDIEIVADKVLGKAHLSQRIDSNRIIREVVQDLENTKMTLGLVTFADLDTSEIENWTTSLSKSIRMLNRLNKQLKEMIQ